MFHFNMHVHNFISGYVIVQHHPNFIYIYAHTKNHNQFSKMKKKPKKKKNHSTNS